MQIISDLLNNVEKDTIIIYLSTKVIYLTIIGLFSKLKVYSNSFKYGGLVGLKYLSKSKESTKYFKLRSENCVKNRFYGSLRKALRKMNRASKKLVKKFKK